MTPESIHVLLVEDNPIDARLVDAVLAGVGRGRFVVEHVETLAEGLARLSRARFDVVLLDLSLPDARRLEALHQIRAEFPGAAVVVLTGRDDQDTALEAVQEGAQDYLVKTGIEGELLVRSLRYAIERQRYIAEIRALSLTDELTGLRNRRGFVTLAEQQVKLAERSGEALLLLFADLDGMKEINDRFGHAEGDRALRCTADLLRRTFRDADIVARLGGDEFAVLAVGVGSDRADCLVRRLLGAVDRFNAASELPCPLSVSVGTAQYGSGDLGSLDGLLTAADAAMYARKRAGTRRVAPRS